MTESQLAALISRHMQVNYPDVLFRYDLAADLKLTEGQARRNKTINPYRGYPDLVILAARAEYHALFVELKKDGENIYATKTEKWGGYATEHIERQANIHEQLRKAHYCAEFSVGLEQTKQLIAWYMAGCKGKLLLERSSRGAQRFTNTDDGEIF